MFERKFDQKDGQNLATTKCDFKLYMQYEFIYTSLKTLGSYSFPSIIKPKDCKCNISTITKFLLKCKPMHKIDDILTFNSEEQFENICKNITATITYED